MKNKKLSWKFLLGSAVIGYILGYIIGGVVGASFSILGAVFLLMGILAIFQKPIEPKV